ncbi:MAG: tyrosine-type recombinase/integrase [Planctomycetaceae bacterium]|nr:tyrosine-type recombinase/integrase [Planctomycetales bacterium]MCB9924361.1 tyrosine-type recombinase/integrase [Planctomycetaceae bacterium]
MLRNRDAIHIACDHAFPAPAGVKGKQLGTWRKSHRWNPNQLRHAAATEIRKRYGLEGAQVALGHASAHVTQIYAETDNAKAAMIAVVNGV